MPNMWPIRRMSQIGRSPQNKHPATFNLAFVTHRELTAALECRSDYEKFQIFFGDHRPDRHFVTPELSERMCQQTGHTQFSFAGPSRCPFDTCAHKGSGTYNNSITPWCRGIPTAVSRARTESATQLS